MRTHLPLFVAALILLAMAVMQEYALAHFLYWRFWWLDLAMHAAGGAAIGFAVSAYVPRTVWAPLGAVLVIGIAWEVFEYTAGVSVADAHFMWDTFLDLSADVVGALIAWGIMERWLRSRSPLSAAHEESPGQTS